MVLYTNVVNGVTNIVPVYITNRIVAPISVVDNIQPSSNLTTATNTVVDTTLSTNIIVNIQDFTDLSTTETYGSSVLGESKRKAMKDYWYRKDTNAVQAFKKLKYKY